jgi:ABC-type polysaccharide/polyol phosphate transport system ATPase subunit
VADAAPPSNETPPATGTRERAPLIRARGLVKHYDEPGRPGRRFWDEVLRRPQREPWHRVLEGVDLDIYPGETVGVLGRNGAGKSTLLAILAGARAQTSGTVERRGRIVPILELGGSFDEDRTARANVIEFAKSFGVAAAEIDGIVAAAEEFADIGDYFDQPLRTHSSGMRSRAAFAAALALKGDLVMLDETLAVGDLSFRLKCYDMIRQLQRQGTAFLLVGHNPNTLANLCSRIVVLDHARLAYDGPPAGAIQVYKSMRLNLGAPSKQVQRLSCDAAPQFAARYGQTISFRIQIVDFRSLRQPVINLGVWSSEGIAICAKSCELPARSNLLQSDSLCLRMRLTCWLANGQYRLMGYLSDFISGESEVVEYQPELAQFAVEDGVDQGVVGLDVSRSMLR